MYSTRYLRSVRVLLYEYLYSTRTCEGRKQTCFTQNMNACRTTAKSVHTSPYCGPNRCNCGLNEAQPRSKRGATTVQTRRYRGQNEALPRSMLPMNAVTPRLKLKRIIPCLWSVLHVQHVLVKAPLRVYYGNY